MSSYARKDPAPQTKLSRSVSLAAVMFSVLAPLLLVLIFFLVSIGYVTAGQTLAPFPVVATALGLISSIWAITIPRSRVVGITTLLVMIPCVVVAALVVVGVATS